MNTIYDNADNAIRAGMQKGEDKGYSGWDDPIACPSEVLHERLEFCLEEADYQGVLTYAAMLYHRQENGTA